MKRCVVVGGGIGGVLTARIMELLGREVLLLEGGNRLGGCAGTFERDGLSYNIGATTIPSLIPDYPLKRLLELINNSPLEIAEVYLINPSIVVYINHKIIKRYMYFEEDLEEWERAFPNLKGHKNFLKLSHQITETLLKREVFFNWNGLNKKMRTLLENFPTLLKIRPYFLKPALSLIKEIYGPNIPEDFYDFLEAQVMITLQSPLAEVSALGLLLAIGYPYTGVGKAKGGSGKLIEAIAAPSNFLLNELVLNIKKAKNYYIVKSQNETYEAEELVLAFPFLENLEVFEDEVLRDYFKRYRDLLSRYSAFVCYGEYNGKTLELYPSHLIILPRSLRKPYFSGYLFLSFLEKGSTSTFTLSTHTPLLYWNGLSLSEEIGTALRDEVINLLCRTLNERPENFQKTFFATPFTFQKYLKKSHLGGIPFTLTNSPLKIPNNLTPFPGLYLAGEQAFSYQGWLGISVGVLNLFNNIRWKE